MDAMPAAPSPHERDPAATAAWPPMFVSHGSPMTALEPRAAGLWWRALGQRWADAGRRPKAVLAVSAHSLAREPVLLAGAQHAAVHDFGGFDPRLNRLRYDAPGAPELADAVAALLHDAGLPAHRSAQAGLDHGIWVPLRELFPKADVPVLPLAWPRHWTPRQLWALGRALAPCVAHGVWVLGSGSITHNLPRVFGAGLAGREEAPATAPSTAFRDWFAERGQAADWPALLDWARQAPHAQDQHPSDEHLLPFFVAAGAAVTEREPWPVGQRVHASQTFGELGMDAYRFGSQPL